MSLEMGRAGSSHGAITSSKSDSPELGSCLLYLASERGLARNSLDAYRRDLEDIDRFLIERGKTLAGGGADDFVDYLREQTRKGQSTKTVTRRVATIRMFLKFRQTQGVDASSILARLERPKPEKSLPHVLSRAQVVQLIMAGDRESYYFERDAAIMELLYASGLRATELCELKVSDANLLDQSVRVMGKGRKERIVPFGEMAKNAIERYLADCRPKLDRRGVDRLFLSRTGHAMERIGLWMMVKNRAKKSGLLQQVGPHVLRHCFATHLVGGGADLRVVQELLGHSDIATTEIYTHVDGNRLKSMHTKFHPRG